jgi:hypothetical protein
MRVPSGLITDASPSFAESSTEADANAQRSDVVRVPAFSAASRDSGCGSTSGPRSSESSVSIPDARASDSARAQAVELFTDVREHQRRLKSKGLELTNEADEKGTGPASFMLVDPDESGHLWIQQVGLGGIPQIVARETELLRLVQQYADEHRTAKQMRPQEYVGFMSAGTHECGL